MTAGAELRAQLEELERFHRLLALSLLAAAGAHGLRSAELLQALAMLEKPSWSSWHRVVLAVREARRTALRGGGAAERQRLRDDAGFRASIEALEELLPVSLEALAARAHFPQPAQPRLLDALGLAVGLRNRVAHDAPDDEGWFRGALAELAPLLIAARGARLSGPGAPWVTPEGEVFDGLHDGFVPRVVSSQGAARAAPELAGAIAAAFAALAGTRPGAQKVRELITASAPPELRGVLLGPVLLGRAVGRGGFATVHEGRLIATGQRVAVKVLRDGAPDEARERLRREAEFLGALSHPGIVAVLGWGEETWSAPRHLDLSGEEWFREFARGAKARSFLVLEWVEGTTLDAWCTPERRPRTEDALRWFADAAGALAAVHAAGFVHRDVKPSNLMVAEGGALKLMDFGIATGTRALPAGAAAPWAGALTRTGEVIGSPAYMSPEQLRAEATQAAVGPASDQYGLCATFYEVLTGRRLYGHDRAPVETVTTRKLAGEPPEPPRALARELSWEIETVLLAGLAPDVAERYPDLQALRRDLLHILAEEPIEHRRPALWRRARLAYRRNRPLSHIAAAMTALAVVSGVQYVRSVRSERAQAAAHKARAEADRALAEQSTRDAEERLGALREEQGRAAFAAHDGERAAILLADAYARGRQGAGLRYALAATLQGAAGLQRTIKAGALDQVAWDGAELVTLGADGTLRRGDASLQLGGRAVIDVRLGRALVRPDALVDARTGAAIAKLAIAPGAAVWFDGPLLLALEGQDLRSFDARTGAPRARLSPGGDPYVVAVNPSGTRIAVNTHKDVTLHVFDAATGARVATLGNAQSAAWLDDERLALAAFAPLRTVHVPDGAPSEPWDNDRFTWASALTVAPGRRFLVAHDASALRLYATQPPRLVARLPDTGFVPGGWRVSFSGDGARFAVTGGSNAARVFASETGREVASFSSDAGRIGSGALSHDGAQLATWHEDGTVRVWAVGAEAARDVRAPVSPAAVAFLPSGALFADLNGAAVLIDPATGEARKLAATASQTHVELSASPDGSLVLVGGDHPLLVETATGRVRWAGPENLASALLAGGRVIAAGYTSLASVDAASGRQVAEVPSRALRWMAASEDGKLLAAASLDGGVEVRDLSTLAVVGTLPCAAQARVAVRRGLLGVLCGGATVYDLATLKPRFAAAGHSGAVVSMAFSPDGSVLATGGADGRAILRNTRTGAPYATLDVGSEVSTIVFDARGELLATGSKAAERTTLWEAATGAKLLELPSDFGSQLEPFHPAFSADGSQLVVRELRGLRFVPLPRERRAPDEVRRAAEAMSRYRLVAGELVEAAVAEKR